jgi:hypothetical protein
LYLDPHEQQRRLLAGHDALRASSLGDRLHGEANPYRIWMLRRGYQN